MKMGDRRKDASPPAASAVAEAVAEAAEEAAEDTGAAPNPILDDADGYTEGGADEERPKEGIADRGCAEEDVFMVLCTQAT